MSNTINPVTYDVEPVDVESLDLPETEVDTAVEAEQPEPQKKSVFARIIGALLAVISVAVVFLNIKVLIGTAVQDASLLNAVKDLLSSDFKLFGILPALADTSAVAGQVATLSLYAFVLCLVLTIVFGIIAAITTKCVNATVTTFSLGFMIYAISIFATSKTNVLDIICLGAAAVGLILYLILACRKMGKKIVLPLIQCVLTLIVFAAVAYGATKYYVDFETGVSTFGVAADIIFIAVLAVLTITLILSYIGLMSKRCLGCDIARALVQFIVALVVCYIASAGKSDNSGWIFIIAAVAAAVISLVQIVISLKIIENMKKKAVAEAEAEEEAAAEAEAQAIAEAEEASFVREEYAEALPYDGGPVEGVELAEEVNPTFVPQPAEVKTAGYDFYNSKSFDPFIASLNEEERNEFTQLFILKYKGVMPEIPDYVVGGDNKAFFQKMFIYLGQYRDRISNALLGKMYQFAIKM